MDVSILKNFLFKPSYDPYDLWSTKFGVNIKRKYYSRILSGKVGAVCIGLFDWLLPNLSRKVLRVQKRSYPIVVAQGIQMLSYNDDISDDNAHELLGKLKSVSIDPSGNNGWAWGLGFPWMSKNGLYPESLAFITHTPYAMEALLELSKEPSVSVEARDIFDNTWSFLDSLLVMYKKNEQLALSYAPVDEPRMVVNANMYAALSYALHAVYGKDEYRYIAKFRAEQLINWVLAQQQKDGSWYYYADSDAGNFIDCFHSCFILKNLLKVKKLLNLDIPILDKSINDGWQFVRHDFYDIKKGLCKRFVKRDIKDPFVWDLYDQAEYLGLLVDFKKYEEAELFLEQVEKTFKKNNDWYCRIDFFGCRWGKQFLRWGIIPLLYQKNRLKKSERLIN